MSLDVVIKTKAQRALLKLPWADRERVEARIDADAAAPAGLQHDVKPMVGTAAAFRLRVGVWRVIFERDGECMIVTRVAHRREVYR